MRSFKLTDEGQKYCTGNAFVTYRDDDKNTTVHNELMSKEELLNHLITVGWPFNISLELIGGGKTFAKLLTRWDEKEETHYYVIAQLQGSYYLVEDEALA